ncbi:TPA: hypothetical protein ACGORA_001682 [Streptococcus suis]
MNEQEKRCEILNSVAGVEEEAKKDEKKLHFFYQFTLILTLLVAEIFLISIFDFILSNDIKTMTLSSNLSIIWFFVASFLLLTLIVIQKKCDINPSEYFFILERLKKNKFFRIIFFIMRLPLLFYFLHRSFLYALFYIVIISFLYFYFCIEIILNFLSKLFKK